MPQSSGWVRPLALPWLWRSRPPRAWPAPPESSIRIKSDPAGPDGNYSRDQSSDDPRFVDNFSATESIATSHAQNDSGMFELNFRDERYLPFEGAGAISTWRIEMPPENNAFDLETISDVILNLNYTARDGGEPLRTASNAPGPGPLPDLLRLFSLKHEFSNEWYRFLHPPDTAPSQTMTLALTMERFPFQFRGKSITIDQVDLFLKFKDAYSPPADTTPIADYSTSLTPLKLYVTSAGVAPTELNGSLVSDSNFLDGLPYAAITGFSGRGSWLLRIADDPPDANGKIEDGDIKNTAASLRTSVTTNGVVHQRLRPDVIEDIVMVCHYSAT